MLGCARSRQQLDRERHQAEPEIDHRLARDDRHIAHDRERDDGARHVNEKDAPDDEAHPQHRAPAVRDELDDREDHHAGRDVEIDEQHADQDHPARHPEQAGDERGRDDGAGDEDEVEGGHASGPRPARSHVMARACPGHIGVGPPKARDARSPAQQRIHKAACGGRSTPTLSRRLWHACAAEPGCVRSPRAKAGVEGIAPHASSALAEGELAAESRTGPLSQRSTVKLQAARSHIGEIARVRSIGRSRHLA